MNITKRENAYRIRVFNGKDANGKFLYTSMTVRFDDPRFEGMTEKKRDKRKKKNKTKQTRRSDLSLSNRSMRLRFFRILRLKALSKDGSLIMRTFSTQRPPVNAVRTSRSGLMKYSVI